MINTTLSAANGSIFFVLFVAIFLAVHLGIKRDREHGGR